MNVEAVSNKTSLRRPKVSVIIPVYNNEVYVQQCVESVLAQTLQELEIICINDGSTDSSKAVLHGYADADSRVRVIDRENSGYGVSINVGLVEARGEYIAILESDDFIDENMYETLYMLAVEHDLDIARANFNKYWSLPEERDQFLELFPEKICNKVINPLDEAYRSCFFAQPAIWSALYKRDLIESNHLALLETPGAAYQDTAFSFKTWVSAKRALLVHTPFVHYRQDNESSSINDPGKIYNICYEYQEIDRWLTEEAADHKEALEPLVNTMRFRAYMWNCGRISVEHRFEFAQMMTATFRDLQQRDLLDPSLFTPREWLDCELALANPKALCATAERMENDASLVTRLVRRVKLLGITTRYLGPQGAIRLIRGKGSF